MGFARFIVTLFWARSRVSVVLACLAATLCVARTASALDHTPPAQWQPSGLQPSASYEALHTPPLSAARSLGRAQRPWREHGFDGPRPRAAERARPAATRLPAGEQPYAYVGNDPIGRIDPSGKIWGIVSKGIKFVLKGGDLASTVQGVVEDVETLTSNDATLGDRALAVLSIASEVASPVSIKDAKHAAKAVGKIADAARGTTSSAARREAMRQQDIPTSQQPASQSRSASGRSYEYEVPKSGGGTQTKSVQQQTMDRSHPGQGHWEAGPVKTDPVSGQVRTNQYGQPKLTNQKSKVDYYE